MALHFHSLNGEQNHNNEKAKDIITSSTKTMTTFITRRTTPVDDVYAFEERGNGKTPLSAIADAFEQLAELIKSKGSHIDIRLKPFCDACSPVSVLFGCLGIAFKFAESEYVTKVRELQSASARFDTLSNILDFDVKNGTVKTQGSPSRNLRRVRQGLDLIRVLFQNFLSSNDNSLKEAASTAYSKVCAPYHSWAIRAAVSAGMRTLPTREQLLIKLNETDKSAEKEMRRYINASWPVIEYIDRLYVTRNIRMDW